MESKRQDLPSIAAILCRLCGAEARFYGRKTYRGKYDVALFECTGCQSLQTEVPYWLEEAYRVEGLGLDVGACQRCLNLSIETAACLTVLGFRLDQPCLDYGSGLGLFSRLMRDRGFDFHACDKYIKPFFMDQFQRELTDRKWSAITAYEVLEHLPSPASDCADLFSADPDIIFFTTELWQGQGLDWWYFVPEGGQHVFFYSEKGLRLLADRHGFTFINLKQVKVFFNNRILSENRPLSGIGKAVYLLKKPWLKKGRMLPLDLRSQLHLLRDRKIMKPLAATLFSKHQQDSFHWINQDFTRLAQASRATKLP